MKPSRRIADHDFGIAQRALESLAATLDDFSKRREYEVEDAIDTLVAEKLTSEQRFALVSGVKEAIWQSGVRFAPGDRFDSYEEMAQWVKEAAAARGFATEEKNFAEPGEVTEDDLRWLYVETPAGQLSFSFQGGAVGTGGPIDSVAARKLTVDLLREARRLQDEA